MFQITQFSVFRKHIDAQVTKSFWLNTFPKWSDHEPGVAVGASFLYGDDITGFDIMQKQDSDWTFEKDYHQDRFRVKWNVTSKKIVYSSIRHDNGNSVRSHSKILLCHRDFTDIFYSCLQILSGCCL